MEKERVDNLLTEYGAEEAIERMTQLLDNEYDEYLMLKLAETYVKCGDTKEAKKTVRKLQRLFPAGEYVTEAGRLLKTLSGEQSAEPQKQPEGRIETGSIPDTGRQDDKKQKDRDPLRQSIHDSFAGTAGLDAAERELEKFYNILRLQNARKQNDFQADLLKSTHFAVLGGRAGGKTLVANIIAGLLCRFGIHPDESAVTVDAGDFWNAYAKESDRGVKNLFSTISDATVIVDNVQKINDNNWIEPMEKLMQDRKSDLSIIITGDRGIKSRFSEGNGFLENSVCDIVIPPYSAEDLFCIAEKIARDRALRIHPSARKSFLYKIERECGSADFRNAITLGKYFDEAVVKMAERYDADSATEADMVMLMPEDFDIEIEEGIDELLGRLNAMTGLTSVKEQIKKRVDAVTVANAARKAGAPRNLDSGTLHMLFLGSPGTGKTTVARLIGKIYRQLGLLPRGDCLVECTRKDLVGQYVGWTAKAVQKKVKEAMGGILFIDEAYAVCTGDKDSFGKEAVNELIAAMENNRDNLLVILAGYTREMEEFMDSNPGFRSRIRNKILFEDYSADEMVDIFKGMVKGKNMRLDTGTEELLLPLITVKSQVKDFGNARGVRNLVEDVIEIQNARLSMLNKAGEELTADQYITICVEDLQKLSDGR